MEELVRSSIAGDEAPEWIGGHITQSAGSVSFVGRGGGVNVLDERHAFDEALGHARAQLAQYVATKVNTEACLKDISTGVRFLPTLGTIQGVGETADQYIRSRAHEISDAIVGGIAASEQYWEQWNVSQTKGGMHSFRRYKCWVLATVDQGVIDAYVKTTLTALENADSLAAAEEANSEMRAQIVAAQADVHLAANTLNAQSWELQRLRERVHYGRRFRLTSQEDCLHYEEQCDFERLHPEWMAPEYLVETQVSTRTVQAKAACQFCLDTPCSHSGAY
jgi:hypothetical protein